MKDKTTDKTAAMHCFLAAFCAVAFSTGAWAATDVYWTGGNGTEAAPGDLYDTNNWANTSAAFSTSYNRALVAEDGGILYVTNTQENALSSKFCEYLRCNGGDVVIYGPIYSTGFRATGTWSASKYGDWKMADFRIGYNNENSVVGTFNHESGSLMVTESDRFWLGQNKSSHDVTFNMNGGRVDANSKITIGALYATGTLNVNGGTIMADTVQLSGSKKASKGYLNLNGGELICGSVTGSGGTSEARFNGGTLRAKAASDDFIASSIPTTVGASGGTVDTGGYAVEIKTALLEDSESTGGGMKFCGGGSVMLSGANTYTGATTVELGTAVSAASIGNLGAGLELVLPEATPADSVYTVFALTDDAEGGLDSDVLSGISAPQGCVLRLSSDERSVLCVFGNPPNTWIGGASGSLSEAGNWSLGFVPVGGNALIGSGAPAALTVGDTFSPDTITFAEGSSAITISGGNGLSGLVAVTNLSASTCVFETPVAFAGEILVKTEAENWGARDGASVRFAGGVTGTGFADDTSRFLDGDYSLPACTEWTAPAGESSDWGIPADSSLTVPSTTDTSGLCVGEFGGSVNVAGGAFTSGVVRTSARRIACFNCGEYVVTNELAVTFVNNHCYLAYRTSQMPYKFEKVTLGDSGTAKEFYFGNNGKGSNGNNYTADKNVWIGMGGMTFADGTLPSTCYTAGIASKDKIYINPWYSDYTIGTKPGTLVDMKVSKETHFGTTDENGVARTVTADGLFAGSAAVFIEGTGRFVVNNVNTHSGAWTVTNTATLAINAGKRATTGTVTVNAHATLEVAESGTAALGGLTLADGATLAFNFTNLGTAPCFALAEGKSVAFSEGAATNITVRVTASEWPKGGAAVLTSGGGFDAPGVNVALAEDSPAWARDRLSVNGDGNLVLDVQPKGMAILFR